METPANDDAVSLRSVSVTDDELNAYVEGELVRDRRSEIEGFLACNPDLAAKVMTALHMQGRSAGAGASRPNRRRGRLVPSLAVLVTCLTFGGAGWGLAAALSFDELRESRPGETPNYVEEALMSQKATLVRTAMASQPETTRLDAAEIRRTMNLRLPILPNGWRVLDVQVYPSDDGPGVSLLVEAGSRRRLNLFVVRANTPVTATPVMIQRGGKYVAYWEVGNAAYALTGDGTREEIRGEAASLSKSGLL